MAATRRRFLAGSAVAIALASHGARRPVSAATGETILLGWVQALTGANSSVGIGFDRGINFRVNEINAGGGVAGRRIELITRDTQGDPTKAVNAIHELISSQKVHALVGPSNSGETLAVTPIVARAGIPQIHAGTVDSLIDPAKFPNAFRLGASLQQWIEASGRYTAEVRRWREVALLGDTSGYGTSSVQSSVEDMKRRRCAVTCQSLVDLNQADLTPDLLRAKDSGAKVVVAWTASSGLLARLLNARGAVGWDVPVVGHPSLGSGEVGTLINRPEYWRNVYQVGFRNCSYDSQGRLGPAQAAFVRKISGEVRLSDTVLWYLAWGYDAVGLVAEAVAKTGSTERQAIIDYWNSLRSYPGIYGDYTFTPTEHNGYPSVRW